MKIKYFFLALFIVLVFSDSSKDIFTKLYQSDNWGQGVSTNLCFNMDYLFRLQHTVDYPDVNKIVEIGFGDWSITNQLYMSDKQYIGYEVLQNLKKENMPSNIQLKIISSIKDVTETGDLLIIKDVLMYLPNDQIDFVLNNILPKFRYALIQITATDIPHNNAALGTFRPLNLQFNNGRKVVVANLKNVTKQTWLIHNS